MHIGTTDRTDAQTSIAQIIVQSIADMKQAVCLSFSHNARVVKFMSGQGRLERRPFDRASVVDSPDAVCALQSLFQQAINRAFYVETPCSIFDAFAKHHIATALAIDWDGFGRCLLHPFGKMCSLGCGFHPHKARDSRQANKSHRCPRQGPYRQAAEKKLISAPRLPPTIQQMKIGERKSIVAAPPRILCPSGGTRLMLAIDSNEP